MTHRGHPHPLVAFAHTRSHPACTKQVGRSFFLLPEAANIGE